MKKIIALIIILGFGGTVFFLGWAQLTVPPDSYGILRSKTFGVDPRPVQEGEFRWVWYKLIPTNVSIELFKLNRLDRAVHIKGVLPQGESYASLAGLKTDFSYEISGSFSFRIKAAALPALAAEGKAENQAGLDGYQQRLAGEIEDFLVQRLRGYGEDPASVAADTTAGIPPEGGAADNAADGDAFIGGFGQADRLEAEILEAFPMIADLSLSISVPVYPDFALYHTARALYGEYLRRQRELLEDDIAAAAGRNLAARLRFDELEKYGELLTKYPILLEYLALENGTR
jgi:hypothetical protein